MEVLGFLAFGTVWFWSLIGLLTLVLIWADLKEGPILASFAIGATLFALATWGNFHVIDAIMAHPVRSAIAIPAYFVFGAAYMSLRWIFYSRDKLKDFRQKKREFLSRNGINVDTSKDDELDVPDHLLREWYAVLPTYNSRGYTYSDRRERAPKLSDIAPRFAEHKWRVSVHVLLWPIDLPIWALRDWVRRIVNEIYDFMKNAMQNLTNRIFSGEELGLREVPPPAPPTPAPGATGRGPGLSGFSEGATTSTNGAGETVVAGYPSEPQMREGRPPRGDVMS